MELRDWLTWIIGGVGSGAITYWLLERLPLANWTSEAKRCLALSLSVALACAAFAVSVALDYRPEPATGQEWVEALFAVAFVAVTSGQMIHARRKLR